MRKAEEILIAVMLSSISGALLIPSAQTKELPKLEIVRKIAPSAEEKAEGKSISPNEIITREYAVTPTFLSSYVFTDDDMNSRKTARQLLEAAGISFPPGTTAIYNPGTSKLLVRHTFARMAQIESFLGKIRGEAESVVNFRFETFQLPASFALEIINDSKQDHTAQRDSVLTLTS